MSKLAEKSPIQYPLTLFLSRLPSMQIIAVSDKSLKKRFGNILENLLDASWISGKVADRAKLQYIKLLGNNKVKEQMRTSDVNKDRGDEFYMNIFSDVLPLAEFKELVKVCLILSNGNARVESGFSIN